MLDFTPDGIGIPVSVRSEHGLLYGELATLPDSPGLVVLAHAAMALDQKDKLLAGQFRRAGLSTLGVNLLAHQEEHFPDVHNNVPLLAKRLVDFLGLLKNRMQMGELRQQPIGLFAANATSPVAVRVAALRDHDIAAVVCRDGLIDLAGVLYLRSLESPLLLLNEESDTQHIASNRRALQEVSCRKELRLIPDIGVDYAVSAGIATCLREATEWFAENFGTPERREAE
ncbi:hypothetical protein [Propionivibrio sp.]|uniref:hypothetical protein n=1 Tax=Propionivibrio sp. TaxID=2212460 RepID=UPI0039E2FBC5